MLVVDEEEFQLILKLKDLKKQYRSEYKDLLDLRAEIQYCRRLVDQCRHRLLTGAPAAEGKTWLLGSRGGLGGPPWQRQRQGKGLRCVVSRPTGVQGEGLVVSSPAPSSLPHASQGCPSASL